MATVVNNDLTRGLRGRVGKWIVFRTYCGKTFASHAPRKPDPAKQSVAQRQTRSAFREAAAWAVQTLKDPKQREIYQSIATVESLPNAYTAALRAYMRGDIAKRMCRSENHPMSMDEDAQESEPAKTSTCFHSSGRRRESGQTQSQHKSHRGFSALQVFSPGGGEELRKPNRNAKSEGVESGFGIFKNPQGFLYVSQILIPINPGWKSDADCGEPLSRQSHSPILVGKPIPIMAYLIQSSAQERADRPNDELPLKICGRKVVI